MNPEQDTTNTVESGYDINNTSHIPGIGNNSDDIISLYTGGQDQIDHIASIYMKIHKLFFGIGIYIIILIVSITIGWSLASSVYDLPFPLRSVMQHTQEKNLLQSISILESDVYTNRDIKIIIKPGDIDLNTRRILSNNNLVLYMGYVLPQYANIPLDIKFQTLSYFETGSYDIGTLDLYINHFILQRDGNNTNNVYNRGIPIAGGSIIDYFKINCIQDFIFFDGICQQRIETLLNVLPIYNLSDDYQGLKVIAGYMTRSRHKEIFCDQLQSYIFFSNNTNTAMREIINLCSKEYSDVFADFISFNSIQEQLNKESISSTVTSSAILNAYKLISTMSIIYYELSVGNRINTTRVGSYIAYLESILKSPDYIQGFYFDVIARFNNYILLPAINDAILQARGTIAQDYKLLSDQIRKINQGDSIAGYEGLIKRVNHSDLIESNAIPILLPETNNYVNLIDRFNESYNFNNYLIRERTLNNDTIETSGLLRFSSTVPLVNNTTMNANFIMIGQRFVVKSISLPRYPRIAISINAQLNIQPSPISEVYEMIVSSTQQVTNNEPICEVFALNEYMTNCTKDSISFLKGDIVYVFEYKDQTLITFRISDSELDTHAKGSYGPTVGVARDARDAISLVLNHTIPITPIDPITGPSDLTGGLVEVQIQKNFESIGAVINRISIQNNTRIIDMNIKDYNFVAMYDPSTQTIINLGIKRGGTTTILRNTQFDFIKETNDQKNLLRDDPITFLLQKDPLTIKRLGL